MYATFNRFAIKMTKQQALSASHAGECIEDVKALLALPAIYNQLDILDPDEIAAELSEYGAWDEKELEDQQANQERIIWLAACDIREDIQDRS